MGEKEGETNSSIGSCIVLGFGYCHTGSSSMLAVESSFSLPDSLSLAAAVCLLPSSLSFIQAQHYLSMKWVCFKTIANMHIHMVILVQYNALNEINLWRHTHCSSRLSSVRSAPHCTTI